MAYRRISNFIEGLNTRDDERRLKPNSDKQASAESPLMRNVEINTAGALQSASGFDFKFTLGTGKEIKAMFEFNPTENKAFLIAISDGKIFQINTETEQVQELGDIADTDKYGAVEVTDGGVKCLVVGCGTALVKVTEGNVAALNLVNSHVLGTFNGRLFIGKDFTVHYTPTDDLSSIEGTAAFSGSIRGMALEGKRLFVFTDTHHQNLYFDYDDQFNISTPLKDVFERLYGSVNHNAFATIMNDIFYIGNNLRVYKVGAEEFTDEQGIPRTSSMSDNIDNSLQQINEKIAYKAIMKYFNKQLFISVPSGVSTRNNATYIWNQQWGSWSYRGGFSPSSFCIQRGSDGKQQLFFSDSRSDNVFVFSDTYAYNGEKYLREWYSKKFVFGDATLFKEVNFVDISGAMASSTRLYVEIYADGESVTFEINNDNIETISEGVEVTEGIIGDNIIGDDSIVPFGLKVTDLKRFKAHIHLPRKIREAHEYQIRIFNEAAGQPWKIDEIGIEYEYRPRKQRNQKYIINETTQL